MTTAPTKMVLPRWNRVPNRDLENLLAGLDADSSLMESARMRERLDALDELKLGLLSGTFEPAALLRLKAVAADLQDGSGDEKLDQVLSEIELRVAVELAKAGIN